MSAGFFDFDERLQRLSDIGDQLEAYAHAVDFEIFRADLDAALDYKSGPQGGRPPFDCVLMFKVLVIQAQNNLSDDRTEFLINDRLSFMRFLGLNLYDKVPDAKTIWAYRERLTQAGVIEGLFTRFDEAIRDAGYIAMSGQLVDSTLVSAPKQRNKDDERKAIKEGKSANDIWPDEPNKASQKDVDARWTLKIGGKTRYREDGSPLPDIAIPTFGYKAHSSIDKGHRFIRKWDVTDVSKHDGKMLRYGLLDKSNTGSSVWADSAYRSKKNEAWLEKNGYFSQIHHRKPRGRSMPENIKRGNHTKSKHRAPVEHVFAVQKQAMDMFIRTVGINRARTKIGMANIVYNMKRLVQLGSRTVTA